MVTRAGYATPAISRGIYATDGSCTDFSLSEVPGTRTRDGLGRYDGGLQPEGMDEMKTWFSDHQEIAYMLAVIVALGVLAADFGIHMQRVVNVVGR